MSIMKSKWGKHIVNALGLTSVYVLTSLTPAGSNYAEASFTNCAFENQNCHIPSHQRSNIVTLSYGPDDPNAGSTKYMFMLNVGDVPCHNDVFGDGAPGTGKRCRKSTTNPFGITGLGYQYSCSENQWCTLPSSAKAYVIRYGHDYKYMYQLAQPGEHFHCSNDRFKIDPAVGATKTCGYRPYTIGDEDLLNDPDFGTESTTSYQYGKYNECASEGQTCNTNSSLPMLVKYGSGNRWFTTIESGNHINCSINSMRYDPIYGTYKTCYTRKLLPGFGDVTPTYGEWVRHQTFPADPGITYNQTISVSQGYTQTISETNSRELAVSIGREIKAEDVITGIGVSASIELSYATSSSFENSFAQSVTQTSSFTCSAAQGKGLYVWKFMIDAQAPRCLAGNGSACRLSVDLGQYACTTSPNPPTCSVGNANCQGDQAF